MKIALFWFRRDLRLEDNTALNKALDSGLQVLPLFIFDQNILDELPKNDARINFIHSQLQILHHQLRRHQSSLLCLQGDPETLFKTILKKYMKGKSVASLIREYEIPRSTIYNWYFGLSKSRKQLFLLKN